MTNSLAEGFARITYSGVGAPHHMMVPVNYDGVPVPGEIPDLVRKDATVVNAEAGLNDYMGVIVDFYTADTLFGLVEFYAVDPGTEERTFLWGYNLGLVGSNGGTRVPYSMWTATFKTIAGGVLKVVGMEGFYAPNLRFNPPFTGGTPPDTLTDYITSDESIVIGRDNAYAFSPITFKTKTADVLRKRAGL